MYIHIYRYRGQSTEVRSNCTISEVAGPERDLEFFPWLIEGSSVFKPFEQVIWGNLAENLIRTGAKLV